MLVYVSARCNERETIKPNNKIYIRGLKMKISTIILTAIGAFGALPIAHAGFTLQNYRDNWNFVVENDPTFALTYGTSRNISGFCLDGDIIRLKGKKSRQYCTSRNGRGESPRCANWETVYPSRALKGMRKVCIKDPMQDDDARCVIHWFPYEYAVDYKIEVYKNQWGHLDEREARRYAEPTGSLLAEFDRSIAACAN